MKKFVFFMFSIPLAFCSCTNDDAMDNVIEDGYKMSGDSFSPELPSLILKSKITTEEFEKEIRNSAWKPVEKHFIDPTTGKREIWDANSGGYDENGIWQCGSYGDYNVPFGFEDSNYVCCVNMGMLGEKPYVVPMRYDEKSGAVIVPTIKQMDGKEKEGAAFYLESIQDDVLSVVEVAYASSSMVQYSQRICVRMTPEEYEYAKTHYGYGR